MYLIDKIYNVNKFAVNSNNDIAYISVNTLYFNGNVIFHNDNILDVFINNELIITNFYDHNSGSIIYNINNSNILKKEFITKSLIGDDIYCTEEGRGKKKNSIDLSDIWMIIKPFFGEKICKNRFYYLSSKKSIALINNESGQNQWEYNLNDKLGFDIIERDRFNQRHHEIVRIIGEYLNIVWLVLSSGRLLGLDNITGKEIYNMIYPVNVPGDLSADKGKEINLYNFKTEIDVENGQLFGLMHKYYWEIDLDNPMETFIYYDISESIKKYGLYPDRSALICNKNIIYFYQGGENNLIGLFDKNKRQIVHSFAIPNANWFTKIEYVGNRLYILDGKNTLYVLENEEEKL